MLSILLFILVISESYGESSQQLSDDPINKVELEPRAESEIAEGDAELSITSKDTITQNLETSTTSKPGLYTWLSAPLTQYLQINPQALQNRVTQFKETLSNLGLRVRDNMKERQLNNVNSLAYLSRPNDSSFHTNRIEAEFSSDNAWLSDKDETLSGPGTTFSAKSIVTNYPSVDRHK